MWHTVTFIRYYQFRLLASRRRANHGEYRSYLFPNGGGVRTNSHNFAISHGSRTDVCLDLHGLVRVVQVV